MLRALRPGYEKPVTCPRDPTSQDNCLNIFFPINALQYNLAMGGNGFNFGTQQPSYEKSIKKMSAVSVSNKKNKNISG
jgi:hypothetical protein